jgi:O-antigen ligase
MFARPAHAIWSNFRPDPRDASSNLYRQLENLNLGLDIRSSPVVGEGFGVPIPHPVYLFDASDIDPLINFVPHNNILYVWLRMGVFGVVAFWFTVGAAVVAACRLARHEDRRLALFGTLALGAVVAWLFQGWLDKGIVSFRIEILVGSLLGAVTVVLRNPAAFLTGEPAPARAALRSLAARLSERRSARAGAPELKPGAAAGVGSG